MKQAPTGPISTAARSASGCRHTKEANAHSASDAYPAEASHAEGTCTYMIRTVSPCCQSAGDSSNPHTSPPPSSNAPGKLSHGCTVAARRRNRPGLANR